MQVDLTLKNPKINEFFSGASNLAPVGEFLYVHSHFIENNFLSEIEVLINHTTEILSKNASGKNKALATKLHKFSIEYAKQVNDISEQTAPNILNILREIYKTCNQIIYT